MSDTYVGYGQGTAAATYIKTGWCPGYIRVMGYTEEDVNEWWPHITEGDSIGTTDSDGIRALDTSNGITLVKFDDSPGTVPGSGGTPTALENGEWYKANGFLISASCAAIQDAQPFCVVAHKMSFPMVRAVHDGTDSSNTYFEDSSIDFIEAGVSSNGKFIIVNENNDNYAYVGSIVRPSGKTKRCRIYTYEDENLVTATAAADFDTADVCYIIPREACQHPLSGIGLMT